MTYSTIYDMRTAMTITDGVQSAAVCSETWNTAREIARDRGTGETYRVTPGGHKWRAPKWWK